LIFIYDWYMLEKDILKCLLNIKNYTLQNYIIRHLIFYSKLLYFFICAMWGEGGFPPQKNPLIFSILTFPDSLMLPWTDGRHFKIDRTRIFSSRGERMVGLGATVPKKRSSHLLYLGFSTPWCYPEKMAGTSNLIRSCNFWRCWTTWHICALIPLQWK